MFLSDVQVEKPIQVMDLMNKLSRDLHEKNLGASGEEHERLGKDTI